MTLLDIDLIRARRHELALSARQVENDLGVGGNWLNSLENDRNTAHVTMSDLYRLAKILGLHPTDLIPAVEEPTVTPVAEALDHDARVVGQVLLDHGARVPVSDLAAALGWTLLRTRNALDVTAARLATVGMRLSTSSTGVLVVRDRTDPHPATTALDRGADVNASEWDVLHGLVHGRQPKSEQALHVAVPRLTRAGLIRPPGPERGSRYTLTDRARRSLLLDHTL